jgi:hypothetical protein
LSGNRKYYKINKNSGYKRQDTKKNVELVILTRNLQVQDNIYKSATIPPQNVLQLISKGTSNSGSKFCDVNFESCRKERRYVY